MSKAQQAEDATLEQALGEAFDAMEDGAEEITDTEEDFDEEAEVSEEGAEETTEEVSEDADEESDEQDEGSEEVSEELKEEIQDAADSDYNEPAPERWPADMKEVYNSLPPPARKAMLEGIYKPMQASYTRSTQELAEMRKTLNPMLETVNQYRNEFQRMGVNPQEAFQRQIAWAAHFAKVGPEQGIKDMQAAYGLGQQAQGQQEEEYLTPVERAMKAKLDALEQQVQQGGQYLQKQQAEQQQQLQQRRYAEVQGGLQDFINEQKDGKPAHPHIEKVAPAIAGLIRGGLVSQTNEYGQPIPVRDQLSRAYKLACDMDPSIRQATTADRSGQVRKAKAAGSVGVVAKSRSEPSDVSGRSLAEELEEAYDKMARTG